MSSPAGSQAPLTEAGESPAAQRAPSLLGRLFAGGAKKQVRHAEGSARLVPPDKAFFHITHWKAGSQWIGGVLEHVFAPDLEPAEVDEAQVFTRPIKLGRVYRCVYVGREEFQCFAPPGSPHFVVLRDLRDTLVSLYFSVRNSHGTDTPLITKMRVVLTKLSEEDGLAYLMECSLTTSAIIQRSWLDSGEKFYRYEDFLGDAQGQFDRIFRADWGLEVNPSILAKAIEAHAFSKLSRGRENGQEDAKSHYRKGVAGDWRQHFTPKLSARFKYLYNDLLVRAGYERDANW